MDALLQDPIKFSLPSLDDPVSQLLTGMLKDAVSNVNLFVWRQIKPWMKDDPVKNAAIGLAWIESRSVSQLEFRDVAMIFRCDEDRLRTQVLSQWPEGRLNALRQTPQYQSVHEAVCEQEEELFPPEEPQPTLVSKGRKRERVYAGRIANHESLFHADDAPDYFDDPDDASDVPDDYDDEQE